MNLDWMTTSDIDDLLYAIKIDAGYPDLRFCVCGGKIFPVRDDENGDPVFGPDCIDCCQKKAAHWKHRPGTESPRKCNRCAVAEPLPGMAWCDPCRRRNQIINDDRVGAVLDLHRVMTFMALLRDHVRRAA